MLGEKRLQFKDVYFALNVAFQAVSFGWPFVTVAAGAIF